ncbi:MAG: TRAP transporter permease [Vicinamibacterales bacterium]
MTGDAAELRDGHVPAAFEAEETEAAQRPLTGPLGGIARAAAIALPLLTLWCAFSGWWDAMTRAAGHLMFTVPLVFLYYPARRRAPISIADLALAIVSVAAFGWIVVNQQRLMWRMVYVDPLSWPDFILGLAAIAVVLEATRRMIGWTLVVTTLLFFVYALGGPLMPGALEHQGVRLSLLVDHLYLVPEGLFNVITGIMATYLFTFLIFASLLQVGGGQQIIMDLASALGDRFVGGPAKVAVVSSALLGMVSGSTAANVVTTGSVTIPLMKRHGFRAVEAAAIETAAGVGGAMMPPIMGAGVFIMSELTGIPLITILAYSILPAILYFASVLAHVHVKAAKRGLARGVGSDAAAIVAILGRGIHLVTPLVFLVALLIAGYTPFYASALSIVALIVVSYARRDTRITPAKLVTAFEMTSRGALIVTVTSATAAVVMGIITSTGLMLKVTSITLAFAQDSVLLGLVLVALISFVVGMSLPTTMSYILVSTLAAPALADLGVPLLTAHLVIFWFAQDSTITPPVCTTAFVAASIAGSPPMRTGWETFRVAKALYIVPLLLVYSHLLSGNVALMLYDFLAALVGLSLLPAIFQGYLRGPLSVGRRLILAPAALACLLATA